jgi:succinate dehydrogenase/fumarate reductase flavoprotein subunit
VKLAVGMEKEIDEGRGPIYFAPPAGGSDHGMRPGLPKLGEWVQRTTAKEKKYGLPPDVKREIAVPLHGETSCIKVDLDMKTSLEGLWAIGDTSYAGSAVAGAVASPPGVTPGSGIMFAVVSAAWAGPSVARYAAEAASPEIDYDGAKELKENTFTPMQSSHKYSPLEAISVLQDVTAPMKYNLRRSQKRLEEALVRLEDVKQRLPDMKAKDFHYLSKCHEVNSMIICAELTFRAALKRTESRGFHFREDYPEPDNQNWLKWIILQNVENKIKISTLPVPINKYQVKPATK